MDVVVGEDSDDCCVILFDSGGWDGVGVDVVVGEDSDDCVVDGVDVVAAEGITFSDGSTLISSAGLGGAGAVDGGSPSSIYSETLDGGSPSTVF